MKYVIIGVVAGGALAGYLYYYFVGCANGTCAITSNPINSTLYGAFIGILSILSFQNEGKKSPKSE
ncbi:MAG: hypothetical protein JNL70_07285 [Saprospiraceae bacterium]|nr:hypothetical protein [Saprospiraceae bacterium]